jgi:formate dehydrogenase maturation protein FdhE
VRALHVIDLSRDPAAIPLLDEVAALALDMWARENGYQKIHINLIGI